MLASASARRQQLLQRLGYQFLVRPADVDETLHVGEKADDYVLRVAMAKAGAVAKLCSDAVVLAADTIVCLEDIVLGKPLDAEAAESYLSRLSGRMHTVKTSCVVISPRQTKQCTVATKVHFRKISSQEVQQYVECGEWRGKAGGYAIQGIAACFAERIDGCITNVVGLPLPAVVPMLAPAIVPDFSKGTPS